MSTVVLSWHEVALAGYVGVQRRVQALAKGRPEPYGWDATRDPWDSDEEAAAAEMAAAKALDRYWEPIVTRPGDLAGDVGDVQVRSTWRANGCLILHEEDDDESPFVLVCGRIPTFTVVGTIRAGEGKRAEFWRTDTGRPAYFVPQTALDPIDGLVLA